MRYIILPVLALIGLCLTVCSASAAPACAPRKGTSFKVFDGRFDAGKPDLQRFGMLPIHVIDRGIWNDEAHPSIPLNRDRVDRKVRSLPNDGAPIVLDIENFDPSLGDAKQARTAVGQLAAALATFRSAAPKRLLGFYGILPDRDYWRAIKGPATADYRAWQVINDRSTPLVRSVDVIFPSIYTFYPDRAGWVPYAIAQICEARRLSNKPVYAFLWPEYHYGGDLPGQPIPGAFWRDQLETMYKYADGIVIWGGFNVQQVRIRQWDANAEWWQETIRFLQRVKG